MSETLRLFIALELPSDVLKVIASLQDNLAQRIPARAVRWTRPEGIHLTIKFLGEAPAAQGENISEALRQAVVGHQAFDLAAQGLGCFPDIHRPRVLWLGISGEIPRLKALAASIEERVSPLGFPVEQRGFNPHLTLARTAREASPEDLTALAGLVSGYDQVSQISVWRAEAVSLMRSELRPDGAHYTRMAHVQLE